MHRYLSLLLFIGLAYNQGWMNNYGDNRTDYGCCIVSTDDGNHLFVGETKYQSHDLQLNERFVHIYKINPLGNIIWEDSLQFEPFERWEPHIIQSLGSGYGYLITGSLSIIGEYSTETKSFANHIDSNGNEISSHTFNTLNANALKITDDNNYIAIGNQSLENGETGWLFKLDSSDNIIWAKTGEGYDGTPNGNALLITADGDYVVSGYLQDDLFISKINNDGSELWNYTYNNQSNYIRGYDIAMTSDGGYAIATTSWESFDWPLPDTTYAILFKLSSNGEFEWQRKYGGGEYYYSEGKEIAVDNDGNIILAGRTKLSQDDFDLYIIKVNANGDLLYERVIQGSPYDEKINHIIVTPNDKVLTAGHLGFSENQGGWNHWVASLNDDGLACISDSNQDGLLTNDDFEFLVERTLQNIFYEELYDWNYDSKNNIVDILRMSDYLYGDNPFNYNCYY